MKATIGELRSLVREAIGDCWGGSQPEEMYEEVLDDDPAVKKKSVLVPGDIKRSISKWSEDMGLSGPPPSKKSPRHHT